MKDLTKGTPLKLIMLFAIPLFLGQLFQLFYSLVDTRIVGQTLGENALAAVGSTSTLSDLMINMMNGATNGFSIIIATCFGAKDYKNLKRATAATFTLGSLFAVIMSVLTVTFLNPILHALNVSDELYADSYSYIVIILMGLLCQALYNCCAASLRSIGDSFTPLIFLIISSVLNVFLDYTFITNFNTGVKGAALATVISQGVSFVLCLIYMWKRYPLLRLSKDDFKIVPNLYLRIIKSGASMALMYSLVNFGTVSLQTAINTFGKATIVAHAAARKITGIYMLPFGVFGQALATFCGQNLGAGKYSRIRKGMLHTILSMFCWCLLVITAAYTITPALISMVTASKDAEIISTASLYLRVNTVFYFVPTAIALIRNSMQGFGDNITPIISSGVELVGKVLIAVFLAPAIGYWGIIVSEPIVWILMVIPLLVQLYRNPMLRMADK